MQDTLSLTGNLYRKAVAGIICGTGVIAFIFRQIDIRAVIDGILNRLEPEADLPPLRK